MKALNIKRIEDGFDWLQKEFENTGEIQSPDLLIMKLDSINATISWAGEQMAIAKVELNKAKVAAYHKLQLSSAAQDRYYAPSLAKDYVNSQCVNENYCYDMAERLCRACVHISDNLRTAISSLKQQMILEGYSQSVPQYKF